MYRQDSDKPGSVISAEAESSTIYPGRPLLAGSIYLPVLLLRTDGPPAAACGNNTARYFNPRGLPTLRITAEGRALLPHVFTLTSLPKEEGGLAFCGTFRTSRKRKAPAVSRRGALRSPDFPLAVIPAGRCQRWSGPACKEHQRPVRGWGCGRKEYFPRLSQCAENIDYAEEEVL